MVTFHSPAVGTVPAFVKKGGTLWIPTDSGIQQSVQSLDSLRKLTIDS